MLVPRKCNTIPALLKYIHIYICVRVFAWLYNISWKSFFKQFLNIQWQDLPVIVKVTPVTSTKKQIFIFFFGERMNNFLMMVYRRFLYSLGMARVLQFNRKKIDRYFSWIVWDIYTDREMGVILAWSGGEMTAESAEARPYVAKSRLDCRWFNNRCAP